MCTCIHAHVYHTVRDTGYFPFNHFSLLAYLFVSAGVFSDPLSKKSKIERGVIYTVCVQ